MQIELNEKIRVLIADDSFFIRTYLDELLRTRPLVEVVGLASSGTEAVEFAARLKPDVVMMDYHMPGKNGVEATADIMLGKGTLPAIIMLSAFSGEDGAHVRKILLATGAHVIEKPSGEISLDIEKVANIILQKIEDVGHVQVQMRKAFAPAEARANSVYCRNDGSPISGVVVIGASTGGPPLVEYLIAALERCPDISIVIVQHMSAYFSSLFTERLARNTRFHVREARDSEAIIPGDVLVVPGGSSLCIAETSNLSSCVFNVEESSSDKQEGAIDNTMISITQCYREAVVGVLLSGMGEDGTAGMRAIRLMGGLILAQEPETAAVRSMPQHAIEKSGAKAIRVEDIPEHIVNYLKLTPPRHVA